jgi:hypothetical protein
MATEALSDEEEARLVGLFDSTLRDSDFDPPSLDETEPAFTARVLMPLIHTVQRRIGLDGVTLAGEGMTRVVPTYLLGHRFYPDMAVSYFGKRLVAYEVKFLRKRGRPNSLATALGQSLLYQLDRYHRVRAVLIDSLGVGLEDLEHCRAMFGTADQIDVIYRVAHPALPALHDRDVLTT